jgi:hypothetical protein
MARRRSAPLCPIHPTSLPTEHSEKRLHPCLPTSAISRSHSSDFQTPSILPIISANDLLLWDRFFDEFLIGCESRPFFVALEQALPPFLQLEKAVFWENAPSIGGLLTPTHGLTVPYSRGLAGNCYTLKKATAAVIPRADPAFCEAVDGLLIAPVSQRTFFQCMIDRM